MRLLDLVHTVLIGRTVWRGLIVHFGAMENVQALPWYVSHISSRTYPELQLTLSGR